MLWIDGVPSGAGAWRARVAEAAADAALVAAPGAALGFVLRPRQFVDLDTLAQNTLAGLRDAGVYARGLLGLQVLVATAGRAGQPGAEIRLGAAHALRQIAVPGPAHVDVSADALPGATRAGKRAWRDAIAGASAGAPVADGPVWAEVALARSGSIVGPLEPILDGLEPVLGRDPRGRAWQEFFPADDRITWLRAARTEEVDAPLLRLRLGPVAHR